MLDKLLVAHFVELTLEKRALARKEKALNKEIADAQETILEQFEEDEIVESIRVSGYNVKPVRELWAAALEGDHERSCNALVSSGHSEYVNRRFDSRSVSALIREYEREGGIPDELTDNLSITEKFKLSITKGAIK